MMVRRFGQWMTGALVVWALMLAFAWFTSEGEPVCSGPLILEYVRKLTVTCSTPLEGLLEVGPVLLGLVAFLAWCGFLVATGLEQRRVRNDVLPDDDS